MKMDFTKFKKVSETDTHAIFQHPRGHEIKVAKAPLSKEYRQQLEKLPVAKMADGGIVADSNNQAASMKVNYKKSKLTITPESKTSKGGVEYEELPKEVPMDKEHVEYEPYNKGGEVNPKLEQSKLQPPRSSYADGGDVQQPPSQQSPVVINVGQQPQMPTQMINPNPGSQFAEQQSNNPTEMTNSQQAAAYPDKQPYGVPITPTMDVQEPMRTPAASPVQQAPAETASNPATVTQNSDPYGVGQTQAISQQGIAEQKQGIQQEAAAQGALGQQNAQILQQGQEQLNQAYHSYQDNLQQIQSQRADLQHDIQNYHVDPSRYIGNMPTGARIMTGIGMILGGIGSSATGGRNAVVDQVQHAIDHDVQAQQTELGKKENLLSFNLKQEGNLRDAMSLTRMQLNDMVSHQIQVEAAKAQSPLAQAAALKAIGQLDHSTAQEQGMMAARKTLLSGGITDKNTDPARLIQFMVPGDKQAKVAEEIKRAQDTRTQEKDILTSFDKASADMKGLGRIGSTIKTPRSLMAFEQSLQPTFGDIEGTVRQSAMDATKANVNPSIYDTDADTAIKRKALETYIHSKKSAPLAKTFGIDLDKFSSSNVGAGIPRSQYREGQTASDGKGNKLVFTNGKWAPVK